MRKSIVLAALALIAAPVLAHDFWIQPARFAMEEPGTVPVSLFVGHGQDRSRWGVRADHVTMFKTRGPDGLIDRRALLRLGGPGFDARIPLARTGTYIIGLQSKFSNSSLPAVRFNDYVEVEGITPIADYRKRNGLERTDGREIYSRRAKAIIQVGPVDAASALRVTKPVNLLLEIVPGRHPQKLGNDRTLPVTVMFRGRPLVGALVKLTDLNNDAEPVTKQRTGRGGETVFKIPRAGDWQLNVVWSEPLRGNDQADFQTTFSSLSFASE